MFKWTQGLDNMHFGDELNFLVRKPFSSYPFLFSYHLCKGKELLNMAETQFPMTGGWRPKHIYLL